MKPSVILAALLAAQLFTSPVNAAGLSRGENFIVMAPNQSLADEVLNAAEKCRNEIAVQWLGTTLPPSIGRAVVHIKISKNRDDGFTWAMNNPARKYHSVWLATSKARAVGSTLKHEITHVVLATRFPDRLPIWLEEGCAGYADDAGRKKVRQGILKWYGRTGNWPKLERILNAKTISTSDRSAYAVACSLTEFLAEREGRDKLMPFGEAVQQRGLQAALNSSFGFRNLDDLQKEWQSWYSARNSFASNSNTQQKAP